MSGQIEEIIALIEQNSDRRLEDAILFLAGSGDGKNLEDSIGFNESDSRFGHWLARQLQGGEFLYVTAVIATELSEFFPFPTSDFTF